LKTEIKLYSDTLFAVLHIPLALTFVLQIQTCYSSPPHPDRLWSPPSLLSNVYRGAISPGVKRPAGAWSWPVTSI